MRARDYRKKARRALRGNWIRTAALVLLAGAVLGVLASVFGVVAMGPLLVSVFQGLDRMVYGAQATSELVQIPAAFFVVIAIGAILVGIMWSLMEMGLRSVGLALLRGRRPGPRMLFPYPLLGKAIVMNLVRTAVVLVLLLLFIAPGIVALYRYSMADYLLVTHPELGPIEALRRSARRMKGRKVKLFCLQLSFIGWELLCVLPAIAVNTWINFQMFRIALGSGGAAFVHTMLFSYAVAFVIFLLCGAAKLFVGAYELVSVTAFFRRADKRGKKRRSSQAVEH